MTTQLDCSIGLKRETTYGTPVVVDQFVEFMSESLDHKPEFLQGEGLRVGARVPRAGRRSVGKVDAGGNVVLEAPIKGLGLFLQAALGTVTNTAVPGQAGVFQQVHTPVGSDWLGSYTIQKGIPPLGGGATHPITFPGAVCSTLELSAKAGGSLEVTTEWTAREVVTSQAYAPPAYPAALDIFTFVQGEIVLGGSVTAPTATALGAGGTKLASVREFSAKWDNGLDGNGWNLGGAGKRTRRPAVGKASITGQLTAEYDSADLRDAHLSQATLALLLTFTHPSTIGTSAHPTLQLYVPGVKLEGGIPTSNGGDVIAPGISWTGLDLANGSAPVSIVYVSTDAQP